MCGIAGFFSVENVADPDTLKKMLDTISYRGPNSKTGMVEGGVALGNVRLSIVDLNGGIQPACTNDRKVIIVFNGEIFNFKSLRQSTTLKDVNFKSDSEIETLLQLYLKVGEGFVDRIKGQFAIAIWDGRDETLRLYRDRFGIRPLFWAKLNKGIIFASEIKALLSHKEITANISVQSVIQTAQMWTNVGNQSAFENIKQLPPAHFLKFKNGNVIITNYWKWKFPHEVDTLNLSSDEEYFEAFRYEMGNAVKRQSMSDVPVASYLSGGIDSTVIATTFQDQVPKSRLKTFSVTFDDPEYDEGSAQNEVVKHFGFEHESVNIQSKHIAEAFPSVVWHTETPLFRTAPTPLYYLSDKVNKEGFKVVMTGEGADEMLLGYDLFRETAIRRFWSKNPDSKWRGSLLKRTYAYLPQYQNKRYFNLILDFYRSTLDSPSKHYAMEIRWKNGIALNNFFNNEAIRDCVDPTQFLESWLPSGYSQSEDIDRAQAIEVQTLMSNYLLSSQGDRMTMAHSVEGRYPFLDDEFVEFMSTIPRRLKLRGLKDKFILRNSYKDKLPDKIRNRPKVAYQAPDIKGFVDNGKVPDYVEELMSPQRIKEVGLFDSEQVTRLLDKARSYDLTRVGVRDNMAFVLMLSTMLLDDMYVRCNGNFASHSVKGQEFQLL